MDEPERLPCPTCGEPATLLARMCPHCGANLLVDLNLSAPVSDGRVRYRVARGLQALGPGAPTVTEIQASLVAKRPAAARQVTRAFAQKALSVLAESGLKVSIDRAETRASSGGGEGRNWLGISGKGLAALILVAMAVTAWRQLLERPTAPAPASPRVAAPKAAPVQAASLSPRELAQRSLPSTVSLRCSTSVGSGFFVGPDLILTNHHVVAGSDKLVVALKDGRTFDGTIYGIDTLTDLAIVKIAATPCPCGRTLRRFEQGRRWPRTRRTPQPRRPELR
jgi:hypothetical protein